MSEIIVVNACSTVRQSNCELVRRADEEVIGHCLGNVLLILIAIICSLVTSVLKGEKENNIQ